MKAADAKFGGIPVERLILGSRGSALAIAQVALTESAIGAAFPGLSTERKLFVTKGDQKLDLNLLEKGTGGAKGLFTKELEEALIAGSIDVAIHSLKDLPAHGLDGLQICAVLERAPVADTLVSKSPGGLDALPRNARVGTSSIRRARQISWLRPDLRIEEWRGNVPTRLRKLDERADVHAIVLAEAGLRRLGYRIQEGTLEAGNVRFSAASLEAELFPAIGQGAIALQTRVDCPEIGDVLSRINHAPTMRAVSAEREVQRLLGGDCSIPVGVRTTLDGGMIRMEGILFGADGQAPVVARAEGERAEDVAQMLVSALQRGTV